MYSFSQLDLYTQCPRRYQYRYVDKLKLQESVMTGDLMLGQAVHATLEYLYTQINAFQTVSCDDLLLYFENFWTQETTKIEQEGGQVVARGTRTLQEYKDRGRAYLSAYYSKYAPFDGVKVVATEMNLVFDLGQGRKMKGVIDRLDKTPDEWIINDYKTNQKLPTQDQEKYTEQLSLYALGVFQKYGKFFQKLKARLHYLHFDLVDEWEMTLESLQPLIQKYKTLIEKVDHEKFSYSMGDHSSFQPQENPGCAYCDYKSICPLRAHLGAEDESLGGELGEMTIKNLIDEYLDHAQREKKEEASKKSLQKIILEYMNTKKFKRVFGKNGSLTRQERKTLAIQDHEKLTTALKELNMLDQVSKVDSYKLKKYIDDKSIPFSPLQEYLAENISEFLTVGKKSDEESS